MQLRNPRHFSPALLITALAFLFCAAGFLIAPITSAQKVKQLPPPPPPLRYKPKPTPTPEYEVVKISSNLVMVPVSITDAQGQPVLGLKPTDFRIEEDGRTQRLTQLGDPEQVPLDIAVLIDVSGSVVARFDFEQQAAAAFLKQVLKPEDRATVFAIDETPRLIQRLATAQVASQSIMTLKPSNGYTAFYDSLLAASKYLDQSSSNGRRRIAVVISDGDDTARILNVSSAQTLVDAMLVTGFPYDVHQRVTEIVGLFREFVGRARAVRRLGSAALDLCYVAAGRMDGFWEQDLKPWDIAAGGLIVEEAGGTVTDFSGAPFSSRRHQVLATNGKIHSDMQAIASNFLRSRT